MLAENECWKAYLEHTATFTDKVKEAKELRWNSRETAVPEAVGTALKSEYRERTPKKSYTSKHRNQGKVRFS